MKKQRTFWVVFFVALLSVAMVRCSGVRVPSRPHVGTKHACPDRSKASNRVHIAMQKGVSFVIWRSDGFSKSDIDISLKKFVSVGFNWVGLIVTGHQDTIASTAIVASYTFLTDANLAYTIAQAHNLGLRVMLKPHVDLWSDPTHWRGQIGKTFTTEEEWTAWFDSYRNFIEHYADLAEIHSVEQFSVGTELSATTHRANDWREIIRGVRARYGGSITYAADRRGEETRITWWDAVDYIGVDAYYPLTSKNDPSLKELVAAWKPRIAALARLASKWEKPILFTEIGYRSVDGANRRPWDWRSKGTVDLSEQADAYQAVFLSVYDKPWFAGMFWWSWGPNPFEGGSYDGGYTPHHKPAEGVLRLWFNF